MSGVAHWGCLPALREFQRYPDRIHRAVECARRIETVREIIILFASSMRAVVQNGRDDIDGAGRLDRNRCRSQTSEEMRRKRLTVWPEHVFSDDVLESLSAARRTVTRNPQFVRCRRIPAAPGAQQHGTIPLDIALHRARQARRDFLLNLLSPFGLGRIDIEEQRFALAQRDGVLSEVKHRLRSRNG